MKFLGRVLICINTPGPFLTLLLPGVLIVGCVNLTKPDTVKKYCSTGSEITCTDNYVPDANVGPDSGPDAQDDAGQNQKSDLPPADEPVATTKNDVAQDNMVVPDGPSDRIDDSVDKDTSADKKDVTGSDAVEAPSLHDGPPADKAPGAEPGPEPPGAEPGAEPSSGPEPGLEPGPEPGLEPGPEPGPEPGREPGLEPGAEPGPEPGPEPPPDGGPANPDTAPSNCTIYSGAGTHGPGTTAAFCIATCDDVAGWNCSNLGDRTVSVNGGAAVTNCEAGEPAVTKKNGYNVFRVSSGTSSTTVITFWGTTNATCPSPDGGVFP